MQVAVCLTTFNRVDCARISMEIIETELLLNPSDRLQGKRDPLASARFALQGPQMRRLLESADLRYYNGDATRSR
jgi:hypothetical protein